ncbi:hypothetical protein JZ751_025062 [Albula glossodonta]|uniref:Uncharacterized protein n=1 Tax=Albula glossodonta TaxID=121402 RepID=A0A8T2PM05_9TELE|nr:hypothetical protein JZ751_025062 [Albula glossodonta]
MEKRQTSHLVCLSYFCHCFGPKVATVWKFCFQNSVKCPSLLCIFCALYHLGFELHSQYVSVSGCMSQPSTVQSPKPREEPDFDPDSVSDSQLNNITLSEMEDLPAPDSAEGDQQEDASELVCGLIKELSSLNRTAMAAHQELENLHCGNKTSKLSLRCPYGSRHNEV